MSPFRESRIYRRLTPKWIDGELNTTRRATLPYLSVMQKTIVQSYWGIGIDAPRTLREIAEHQGLTLNRTRALLDRAVRTLLLAHAERNQ